MQLTGLRGDRMTNGQEMEPIMEKQVRPQDGDTQQDGTGLTRDWLARLQLNLETAALTQCWPDWHDKDYVPYYSKFYLILDGQGEVEIDGTVLQPKPGQLLLMPAGHRQSYRTDPAAPYRKYWCHFTAEIGGTSLFETLHLQPLVTPSDPAHLQHLFSELVRVSHLNTMASRFREKALLHDILALFAEEAADSTRISIRSGSMTRVEEIRAYMAAHLQEDLKMEEVARHFHFHPGSLTRMFRQTTGMPPTAALRRMRLERARFLLETTMMTQQEVAEAAGFFDVHHFSRNFRAHTGYTPGDYRRMLEGGTE